MAQLSKRGPESYSWLSHPTAHTSIFVKGNVQVNHYHPKPPTVHAAQIVMSGANGFAELTRFAFRGAWLVLSLALYAVFRAADVAKALERACGGSARQLPLMYWSESDKLLAEDCDDDD
jgi:hypothetical protein